MGLAALKLTKLFGIDDFPAANDSWKVLIIIIYCYLIIRGAVMTEMWRCESINAVEHIARSEEIKEYSGYLEFIRKERYLAWLIEGNPNLDTNGRNKWTPTF